MDILKELLKINNDKDYLKNITAFITNKLKNKCDTEFLSDGSIIAHKPGSGDKVIVNCRVDFPHIVITDKVCDSKYKISPIGSIDPRGVIGMKLQTDAEVFGVCLSDKDAKTVLTFEDLYFETPCAENCENSFAYISEPSKISGNSLIGVNVSNSLCIAAIIESALNSETDKDVYFAFTAGANANFSGLKTAAATVNPKYILSIVSKNESADNLNSAGILVKEKDFIASNYLVNKIAEAAKEENIDSRRIVTCELGDAMNMFSPLSDFLIGVITIPVCNKNLGNEMASCKILEKARNLLLKTIEYI